MFLFKQPNVIFMRIRSRKKLKLQRIGIAAVILLPVVLLGSIFGYVGYLYEEIPSFGIDASLEPDTSDMIHANYTRLAEMAGFYDYRYENYHIPFFYSVRTEFYEYPNETIDYENPVAYGISDNGALWTGSALVGFVGKYLAGVREGNDELRDNATRVIRKLVYGMSMMLEVPNGGLGPEYGAIVARLFLSPENRSNLYPQLERYFDPTHWAYNHVKYFNGTGNYSQWMYSDFTSNDEYGGYYMGIALAYKYVDDPYVREKCSLIIDQICNGFIESNWLGIGGFGGPTGVDQKSRAFGGGSWALLVLKMGALAHPEKYERLYYHYAVEQGYAYYTKEGNVGEIVANYYAFNFGIDVQFALLMLEEDPSLRDVYLKNFNEGLWSYVKYHRNPYFNAIYLAVNGFTRGENVQYEMDVEDQLMEFDINHFPDVHDYTLTPPPAGYELMDFSSYIDFFENNAIGRLVRPLFMEYDIFTDDFYNKPLTVKMKGTSIFMWDRNPFRPDGSESHPEDEEPGSSFSAPYWIMRGFVHMNATGERP